MKNLKRLIGVGLFLAASAFGGGAYATPDGYSDFLGIPDVNVLNVQLWDQQCTAAPCVLGAANGLGITTVSGFGAAPVIAAPGITNPFVSAPGGTTTGSIYSIVLTSDAHNPFGLTGLTFVYQVLNNATSDPAGISRFSVAGFLNDNTEVGYVRYPQAGGFPGGGLPANPAFLASAPPPPAVATSGPKKPSEATRSAAGGDVIGFNFEPTGAGTINPGGRSPFLIVYTDTTIIGFGSGQIIDGGVATQPVYAPIPEPETYAMMLAGLGLMGFVARRRRAAKTAA